MKTIKTILGVLAVAGLACISTPNAGAQENANRDDNGKVVRGPYHTNGAWDNWFIGVGAGVNSTVGKGYQNFGGFGLATDVFVGKWFTPSVGARIGWKGATNKVNYTEGFGSITTSNGKYWSNAANADLLWNISNAFSGYKETRTWDVIPYARFSYLVANARDGKYVEGNTRGNGSEHYSNQEYGAGFGIINDFRLGKLVDIFVDFSALAVKNDFYGKTGATRSRVCWIPSATAGLVFNLQRNNFDRHHEPVVVPVPCTVDQYNSLKDRVDVLQNENASLKNEIEKLKNQPADTVVVGENILSPAIVYFGLDKATLTERELAHLDFYVNNVMSKVENHVFVLTGSADKETGNPKYNQDLSERRVNYIHNILVEKYNISKDMIIKAEGDTNNKFKPYVLNRCVTIE